MEVILASKLSDVFVAANTSGLESLAGELLYFEGDEMGAEWELINAGLLTSEVEDSDLGIRDTTAVAGLGVWLVLAITVASCWTSSHDDDVQWTTSNNDEE